MQELTSRERIANILKHQPVDRIGAYEHFWNDTYQAYREQGRLREGETLEDNLHLDIEECWAFNFTADLDWRPVVLEETEETQLIKDGNGAILRRHRLHDTTPEHVDFTVKSADEWKDVRKLLANADFRRINFRAYREARERARKANRFFVWSGVNVFECIHPLCGHENLLVGMALDPDWVTDMANVYADLTIALQQELFAKEGYPDGIWYYEDMGFKERPFMSPAMYRELIMPAHVKTCAYAHSLNLPVIMHSCGFIEPLLPGMVEAGIDCLQVIEIKAGMDLLRVYKNFGDKIALMGGIDVREIYPNDRARIDAELEKKIPIVKEGFGYCLHSDHSIPKTVEYDTLRYFIQRGLELGTY